MARKIAVVENECKLDTDVDEYVDKFKWELMQVVHAWASVSVLHFLILILIIIKSKSKFKLHQRADRNCQHMLVILLIGKKLDYDF